MPNENYKKIDIQHRYFYMYSFLLFVRNQWSFEEIQDPGWCVGAHGWYKAVRALSGQNG